jgi:fermentation-respiration switch protein FrsA (DUF1100 family)
MISLFLSAVAGYLMLVLTIILTQRSLMYFPTREWSVNPTEHGLSVVSYPTEDGLTLTSWYARPKDDRMPVFVFFQGNAGNISHRVPKLDYFKKLGYGFLLAEYRGFGKNAGSPTETGLYDDARAAIHWLIKDEHITEERLILYGESLGCGVAAQMALEFPKAHAVILEAPFTSGVNIASDTYPWLGPFTRLTYDKYDNISKIGSFTAPTLIISGDHDRVIPHRHSEELLAATRAAHKKLVSLQGGDHNDLVDFGLLQAMQVFLEENKSR